MRCETRPAGAGGGSSTEAQPSGRGEAGEGGERATAPSTNQRNVLVPEPAEAQRLGVK